MKTCTKCNIEKPLSEFHNAKNKKGGKMPACKQCRAEYGRKRYIENREAVLESCRAWAKANPNRRRERYAENPERERELMRKWQADNRDKNLKRMREYHKEYYAANREKVLECNREYRKNNPEKSAARVRNRRARKQASEGAHTSADILRLLTLQRHKCAYCKACVKKDYHVDHIIALSRGGRNDASNLQILCPTCNLRKHVKCPIEFAQENGMLI